MTATSLLDAFVSSETLEALVRCAVVEDLGADRRDITTACTVSADQRGKGRIVARERGRLCGTALVPTIVSVYGGDVRVSDVLTDGSELRSGQIAAVLQGPLASLLIMERVILNFMGHLSGVATLTARYVDAVAGTRARIYDTRKTLPGLRGLQKYAVVCGGGSNHRLGLHDAVLIKDNHIAHLSTQELPNFLTQAFAQARLARPGPKFVEVEVDTLDQLKQVLPCRPDRVLLDNMCASQLCEAVVTRDRLAPQVELEASGCVRLETALEVARTGVEMISVGAMTHSAPALDLAMDIS